MEFHLPLRVYIEDTDAGGIVFYVNYLKYMERARTEFMRTLGFGKAAVGNNGLMFVVSEAHVNYRRSAQLDDCLDVSARLSKLGRAGMTFYQEVYRGSELLCDGDIRIACVDSETRRPKAIPDAMRAALAAKTASQPSGKNTD